MAVLSRPQCVKQFVRYNALSNGRTQHSDYLVQKRRTSSALEMEYVSLH